MSLDDRVNALLSNLEEMQDQALSILNVKDLMYNTENENYFYCTYEKSEQEPDKNLKSALGYFGKFAKYAKEKSKLFNSVREYIKKFE
ncbi:unnamed protein product [Bursaphelenchus okinawaensis]|uniref:Uncharacterized protein n=1 Tax=Bursaphelenchus okinawaensis TaxID=465554 RepID=A0A811L2K1_9BILA|nr:unnamed protein product [Bursaphelenchus okinawaensis]CAG9117492.1 unnamed protein product [Bursaphelenchus okinawaensis]